MRARVKKAFTLVEILIVVVILGILAAIVVPQFTSATQDAQAGNILAQLDTLNNQYELYKARHNNQDPASFAASAGTVNAWDDMLLDSNNYSYLKAPPRNPACPSTGDQFALVLGAAAANMGWNFDDLLPIGAPDGINDSIQACYFNEGTGKVTTVP